MNTQFSNNYILFTKTVYFEAAHRLWNSSLSPEKNKELFGKCTHIHGHNFKCFITLKGEIHSKTGMICNAHQIKKVAQSVFLDQFDHSYLNEDIVEFKELIPTTENICIVIWNRLVTYLPYLYSIKIQETPSISAEYLGNL